MRRAQTLTLMTVAALAAILAVCAPAGAKTAFQRVFTLGVAANANEALARTPNGNLHVLYQTTTGTSAAPTGLATTTVSASGKLFQPVQALSGWGTSLPGLTALPGGGLLAAFGAVSAANVSSLWTISSSDGGQTWSAPAQTSSPVVQAYAAALNAQALGATPILTLSVAGGVTTQQGTAANAPAAQLTDAGDDFATDVNSAVDAATGSVLVSWSSSAASGGDFIRPAAPSVGTAERVPGETRDEVQLAGRTGTSAGIYAPYTTDGTKVRLLRYGSGTVAVGSLKGVRAAVLGVATGPQGRIWVMWGDDGGVALTRSNMALTRFEPIQHLNPGSFTLYRVYGDGRLGPLDMFVDQVPASDPAAPGGFCTRVLPLLSVGDHIKVHHNKQGAVTGYSVTVTVTDAGDAVDGATVKLAANAVKTGKSGSAQVSFGAAANSESLTVTAPTYRPFKGRLKL